MLISTNDTACPTPMTVQPKNINTVIRPMSIMVGWLLTMCRLVKSRGHLPSVRPLWLLEAEIRGDPKGKEEMEERHHMPLPTKNYILHFPSRFKNWCVGAVFLTRYKFLFRPGGACWGVRRHYSKCARRYMCAVMIIIGRCAEHASKRLVNNLWWKYRYIIWYYEYCVKKGELSEDFRLISF